MSACTRTTYKSPAGTVYVDSLSKQIYTAANQLLSLPKFGGEKEPMTATQGGSRPRTSYSGTTHTKLAVVDFTAYNWKNRLQVLDLLGADYFHRLPADGDWPEHGHTVTRGLIPCTDSNAAWQSEQVKKGRDGLAYNRADRDRLLRSGLWSLAVYKGRTGTLKALQKTHLYSEPSYNSQALVTTPRTTVVKAIMEVNVDGKRWFVTDKGEWGYSDKWSK